MKTIGEFLKENGRTKLYGYCYESDDPRTGRYAILSLHTSGQFKVDFIFENSGEFKISDISTTCDSIFQATDIIRGIIRGEENYLAEKYGPTYKKVEV